MTFDSQRFLQNTSTHPGIYQMFAEDELLYVGKAGNLRKRLASYFRKSGLSVKNQSLMEQVTRVETIITQSETEALILENNLIKKHTPKYNILLRDDKSYPYIQLTEEVFPRLKFYRGSRKQKGKFYGPYPSAGAVKETLEIMQKVFMIRNCDNTFFKHRTRPCLQYQIKRCTAPCVGLVSQETYQQQIDNAVAFLEGKNETLIKTLEEKMLAASEALEFESAALYRNQLQSLRKVLEKQFITHSSGDADVIAVDSNEYANVVQVVYFRGGRSLGSQSYFPKMRYKDSPENILQAFIEQNYFEKCPPSELILSHLPNEIDTMVEFLTEKFSQKVKITTAPRQHRLQWLRLAKNNAKLALQQRKTSQTTLDQQFKAFTQIVDLPDAPVVLACVDISHTMGEATVGSYVVFDEQGPKKSDYRKYNIKDVSAGDDYGAMRQLLQRRFKRFKNNQLLGDETQPTVLLVDGGKGQFNMALEVLAELGIDDMVVIGVAKGAERKAGQERLLIKGQQYAKKLDANHPALLLIQQIRDESHRFAITGHRKKRDKKRNESILKEIEGIGDKRRQSLLKYFAGIKGVSNASVDELAKVSGISRKMANTIYEFFHGRI